MLKLSQYSVAQLQRAVAIKYQIESLQQELDALEGSTPAKRGRKPGLRSFVLGALPPKKRTMSPEAKARIAAAQRERWAKVKGVAAETPILAPAAKVVVDEPRKKRKMSKEAKARIAAAAKARWAKVKEQQATA